MEKIHTGIPWVYGNTRVTNEIAKVELHTYTMNSIEYFTARKDNYKIIDDTYFESMVQTFASMFKSLNVKFNVKLVKFKPEIPKITFTIKSIDYDFLNTSITFTFLNNYDHCVNSDLSYDDIIRLLHNNEFDEHELLNQDKIAEDDMRYYNHLNYFKKCFIFKIIYFIYYLNNNGYNIYSDIMTKENKDEFDKIINIIKSLEGRFK